MEKNNYSANIDNLIALCHIIDEFEDFEKKLKPVISPKYNRDFTYQLWEISEGKFKIGARKAKKFYNENKVIICKINSYSNILDFINKNYSWHGKPNEDFEFFYNYILSHKEEKNKIILLLKKLKELKFDKLEFNSNLDFTNTTHVIHSNLFYNTEVVYLDNLTVIPSYSLETVSYKSSGSNYEITIEVSGGKIKGSHYRNKIVLNDLTFNPDRLPNALTTSETFVKIIALTSEKKQEYSAVKSSVDLSISINDLYLIYDAVNTKINKIENVEKKQELIELLQTIKESILKMQEICNEYNKDIIKDNPNISETLLEDEKENYLRKRTLDNLHIW